MGPALIGAGASLLGGILGRNSERKAIAAQNDYNNPANIRARAEAAGFNPLLFVGPGVGNQMATGGSNYMGSAIADAGLMLSEALAKRQDLRKLDRLKDENEKLSQQVTDLTIRPKFGGIYSQREATPSKSAALGGANDAAPVKAASVGVSGVASGGVSTQLRVPRVNLTVRSDVSDGGDFEQRWGEVGGAIGGLGVMAADLGTNGLLYSDRWAMERETARRQAQIDRGELSFGVPLSTRDGIEMPPGYVPTYPKSKKDRLWDYWSGANTSKGWPKFQLGGRYGS